jgi:hypothetical protein
MIVGPVSAVSLWGVEDEGAVILAHGDRTVVSFEVLTGEAIQVVRKVRSVEVTVSLELKDFPLILLFVLSEATLEELQAGDHVAGIGALDRD